jgi:small redox-active disulfide protein 2
LDGLAMQFAKHFLPRKGGTRLVGQGWGEQAVGRKADMSQDEITRIRVGDYAVGIVGLKQVLEQTAQSGPARPDHELEAELLNTLSRRNYVPEGTREEYGKAFLREFKKSQGIACEERGSGLEIKVLGPGCAQCDRLEKELIEVMAEMGVAADVEHVRDIKAIGGYGVMGTPALIVNGDVKCVGRVPPRNTLKKWLMEAKNQ